MFCLSKKTDYALSALAFLTEQPDRVASAREIAQRFDLPSALLMNVLKQLQHREVVKSTRGVKGGYSLSADLAKVSLFDLIRFMECDQDDHDHEAGHECTCGCEACSGYELEIAQSSPNGPVQALHFKLIRFLKGITLSDVVQPGRRIDVPLDGLRRSKKELSRKLSVEPVGAGAPDYAQVVLSPFLENAS